MEVLERIANHEFAGELREIVEALIPLRRDRWETEDYLRATLMSGDGKDLHKEVLRDSLLEAICGNDKYPFGYAYYFLGSWKNRTSGGVVIEDAFCYANEASVNYSLWCEEQTTAIEQADNGCKADLALNNCSNGFQTNRFCPSLLYAFPKSNLTLMSRQKHANRDLLASHS